MARTRRLFIAMVVLSALAVVDPPPAAAACHAFSFKSVSPSTVGEGGSVTVTVERDGAVNPSSVQVTSINGSAQAGQDFPAVNQTVSMTSETEKSFTVATTDDAASEPAESFKLHLSNGSGCTVNPNFQYGSDATVTIQDNDAAAPATAPPTAAATTAPSPARATTTTVPATSTTTVAADTSTTALDTSTSDVALAQDASDNDDDGGGGGGTALILALIVLVLAAGGAGFYFYRRRAV